MSFEPVDVLVVDDQDLPVEGVLVKVYDPTGTTLFTQALTASNGKASFLLETLNYSMRFYKYQVGFSQPQLFTVLAAPNTNLFAVYCTPFVLPIATDPRLCRCSGYFRDLDGSPRQNLDIHFIAKFDGIVLEEAGVFASERHIRTDKNGYAQIDLIRCANYQASIETLGGDSLRCVSVPDAPSTNLPDLLLPIVELVTFSPAGPYSLGIGPANEITITPTVFDSAGRQLTGTAISDVIWDTSDRNVAVVLPTATTLVLRGISAGTANLTAARKNLSIIRLPNVPVEGQPVSITVT